MMRWRFFASLLLLAVMVLITLGPIISMEQHYLRLREVEDETACPRFTWKHARTPLTESSQPPGGLHSVTQFEQPTSSPQAAHTAAASPAPLKREDHPLPEERKKDHPVLPVPPAAVVPDEKAIDNAAPALPVLSTQDVIRDLRFLLVPEDNYHPRADWLWTRSDSNAPEKMTVERLSRVSFPPIDTRNPKPRLLVVIPFRNDSTNLNHRWMHVAMSVPYWHRYLQLQQIDYKIVLSEQHYDGRLFNRGYAINVGYYEFRDQMDYLLMVDADSFPVVYYNSTESEWHHMNLHYPAHPVTHMAHSVMKYDWKLYADEFFGVAVIFTKDAYERINGFSNNFWGWGAEDDNLYWRVNITFGIPKRPPAEEAMMYSIPHGKDGAHGECSLGYLNFDFNHKTRRNVTIEQDGLSTLKYDVLLKEWVPEWGGFYRLVTSPRTPLLLGQRDRVTQEDVEVCKRNKEEKEQQQQQQTQSLFKAPTSVRRATGNKGKQRSPLSPKNK